MITAKKCGFDEVMTLMGDFSDRLSDIPKSVRQRVCEIRLRAGRPIVLELGAERLVTETENVSAEELTELINRFCGYSVHSYQHELCEGYLTLRGGHRVGISGTAVTRGGAIENIKEISSVSIRVAQEIKGCADELYGRVYGSLLENVRGLLIIGRPLSAKTTVLRDLIRTLSREYKLAVIDERCEIAAMNGGAPQNDIGVNTDVICGVPKEIGIYMAIRSLSPEIIACDEISDCGAALKSCIGSGVRLILTAHCSGLDELMRSERLMDIIRGGGISHIALLGTGRGIGRLMKLWTVNENECIKHCGGDNGGDFISGGGNVFFREA